MPLCSKCSSADVSGTQKWCRSCYKTYQTEYRETLERRIKKRGREDFRRDVIRAFSAIEGYVSISKVMEVISSIE